MNVQERDQLLQFFSSLQRTAALPRDRVAEDLIRQKLADGVSVYDLVQRALGLTLTLEASQARTTQLQALCERQAAQLAQLAQLAEGRAASSLPMAPDPAANESPAFSPSAPPSLWSQGLLRQVGGTAVGVAAGVIAGSLLLEGWQRFLGEDASVAQAPVGDSLADAGADSWDFGDAGS